MKIIRPQNNTPTPKEEKLTLFIDGHEVTSFTNEQKSKPTEEIIGNLMDEVIAEKTTLLEDKYQVTIYFTERQYNLWKKKGGEKWLKRALVGQKLPKKR